MGSMHRTLSSDFAPASGLLYVPWRRLSCWTDFGHVAGLSMDSMDVSEDHATRATFVARGMVRRPLGRIVLGYHEPLLRGFRRLLHCHQCLVRHIRYCVCALPAKFR